MRHALPITLIAVLTACSSSHQGGQDSLTLGFQDSNGFTQGQIRLGTDQLVEGGTTEVFAQMVDGRGAPVRPKAATADQTPVAKVDPRPPPVDLDLGGIVVTATSACLTTGKAAIDIPQNPDSEGRIIGAYTDLGCQLDDELTIRATLTRTGQSFTATSIIPSIRFGNLVGDAFTSGRGQLLAAPIASGGSTVVRFEQRSPSGALRPPNAGTATSVSATSDCISAGMARFEGLPDVPTNGIYTGTYTDFGCQLSDTLTITMTRDEGQAVVEQPIPVVRLGTRSSLGVFSPNQLSVEAPDVSPFGVTNFAASILDAAGNPFPFSPDIPAAQFIVSSTSPCQTQGLASLQVSPADAAGVITGTYTNAGCTDPDTIMLRAVLPSSGAVLTANGTVVVSRAASSIRYTGPDAVSLRLRGLTEGQTASVPFTVVNSSGDPIPGQRVDFTLSTQVGGLSLSSTSSTTNQMGVATAIVNTGRIPINFAVTARTQTATGESLTSQSRQIVVFSDIPAQSGMSLATDCGAIEGFLIDGVESELTLRIADRYGNFFVPGTQPNAIASGGAVNGGCVINSIGSPEQVSPSDSACSFTFRSQGVRPANGIAYVMAYLEGEETFIDVNGNGLYDEGEPFTDRGNAFLDADGNRVRDADEIFIDRQSAGAYSDGNGAFDGYVCNANVCSFTGTDVFVNAPIILSGPAATIQPPSASLGAVALPSAGTYQVNGGTIGRLTFNVVDSRGNQIPPESVIELVATNGTHIETITASGQPSGTAEIDIRCPGSGGSDTSFSFDLSASPIPEGLPVGATNASTLTLIATTPSGVETVGSFVVRSEPKPQPAAAPGVTFAASQRNVVAGPDTTIDLTWSSVGADSCSAVEGWTSSTATEGSARVLIDQPGQFRYTISCANAAGLSTAVEVDVVATAAP